VVKVIAKNAFFNNPFPVILSLEDHCCLLQQKEAASIFRVAFGEKLLLQQPLEAAGGHLGSSLSNTLPSPRQLLEKIILKHKKLATPNIAGSSETPQELKEVPPPSSLSADFCTSSQEV
jgi:hypothetical protein